VRECAVLSHGSHASLFSLCHLRCECVVLSHGSHCHYSLVILSSLVLIYSCLYKNIEHLLYPLLISLSQWMLNIISLSLRTTFILSTGCEPLKSGQLPYCICLCNYSYRPLISSLSFPFSFFELVLLFKGGRVLWDAIDMLFPYNSGYCHVVKILSHCLENPLVPLFCVILDCCFGLNSFMTENAPVSVLSLLTVSV